MNGIHRFFLNVTFSEKNGKIPKIYFLCPSILYYVGIKRLYEKFQGNVLDMAEIAKKLLLKLDYTRTNGNIQQNEGTNHLLVVARSAEFNHT